MLPLGARLFAQNETGAESTQPSVRKTVYGWYPARFGTWDTPSIAWDALTHICFRSVVIAGDGSLARPAGNPPPEFVEEAHRRGVKVCVLVWVNSQVESDSYLAYYPREAAQNLLAYVQENGLDGVAYDDEHWRETNSLTGEPNGPLTTRFFQALYQAFKGADPAYHIAFAAPPVISPKDRFSVHWLDWGAIAGSVDAIIPMVYTANPPGIGWTTNSEPLAGGRPTERTVARDLVTLMGDYYEATGGQKDKLLLGVWSFPWNGFEFRCRTAERLSPILERGTSQPFEFMEAQAQQYGKRWDWQQQSAWYVYQNGDDFVQGWYDDAASWSAKLDYVNQEGLGGVGIWVLRGGHDAPAMWEMLRAAFAPPKKLVKE